MAPARSLCCPLTSASSFVGSRIGSATGDTNRGQWSGRRWAFITPPRLAPSWPCCGLAMAAPPAWPRHDQLESQALLLPLQTKAKDSNRVWGRRSKS